MTPNWFLALPLPPAARWHDAAAAAPSALRRFDPADLHLTVAFLGPCGEARALAAWHSLAALSHPPIQVRAGGWRAFGAAARPSAYGLTLAQGQPLLSALLERWGLCARTAAGCAADPRPALPHLSLLRPSRREAERWRGPMEAWMAGAPLPTAPATLAELALYTWAEDRQQRLFSIRCSRPLASPA